MTNRQKVFGIGFHKTGTKSLCRALEILGYRVCGPIGARNPEIASEALLSTLDHAHRFDAVQDNPFPLFYRELDQEFPDSKFILTTEDPDIWIARAVRYFGSNETPMRKMIYGEGSPVGNEKLYRERFVKHQKDVETYFKDRPKDLLIWPLTRVPGWEILCDFLEMDIPEKVDFPHKNKGGTQSR